MPRDGFLLVLDAISFAAQAHAGQNRKDGRTPYIAHTVRVMSSLQHQFKVTDPEILAAAVLHDTIEDTTTDRDDIIEHFGPRVAEFVAALSKDTRLPEEERERRYLETLANSSPEVKLCKLGDMLDNLIDSLNLPEQQRRKKIGQAHDLLAAFGEDLPEPASQATQAVRRQVAIVEQSLE